MRQNTPSYGALIAILILAGTATTFVVTRPVAPPPTPVPGAMPVPLNTYLIDVAGWYEITPNERAVATPIELTIDGLKALPETLGEWHGEPYTLGAEVDAWFENPDLAVSSIYRDSRGHQLWLSAFGSRGQNSYYLFEHTPVTSYPAAGWTLVEKSVAPIAIGDKSLYVQKATLSKDGERRVVLYWYLWSDLNRDPEQGVMTMRLHIPVVSTDADALVAGTDFLRTLFPQVVGWHRF